MGLLIDTSAAVALEAAALQGGRSLSIYGAEPLRMAAVTYAELLVGVRLADTPRRASDRRAWVEALVSQAPIVDFDAEVAVRWADVCASLRRTGQLIPTNDIAVAATALHMDFRVLVGPAGEVHFRRVPDLGIQVLG